MDKWGVSTTIFIFLHITHRLRPFLVPRLASRSCFLSSSILTCNEAIIQALSQVDRAIYSDGRRRILCTHQCMTFASPSPSSISFLLLLRVRQAQPHSHLPLVLPLPLLQFHRLLAFYQAIHQLLKRHTNLAALCHLG